MQMAPTVHKPVHVKTKQQEVTATVSSAEIHITCCLMNINIIDDNNEKTRPIYTKKYYESNFPVAKQSKV